MSDTGATSAPPPEGQATRVRGEAGVQIARNSLWLMVDTVASMLVQVYVSILAARILGPDHMGHLNYVIYFASVLRMVTEVAIPVTVRKFAAEFSGREDFSLVKTLVSRAMRLQGKLVVVALAIGFTIVYLKFPKDMHVVATLAVLNVIPGMLLGIPTGALWATGNLRHNTVSSLLAQAVNVVGVTFVLLMGWGLVGIVASLLASKCVDSAVRYVIFRRLYARIPGSVLPGPLPPELRVRMRHFALQQFILALLWSLLFDRMEVFVLHKFAPARQIAFFSISLTLAQYMLLIPQNLANSVSVNTFVAQGRDPREAIRTAATATWFIFLFAAPEVFGAAALADPLLRLMYGVRYLEAVPVLMLLSLFSLVVATSKPTQDLLVSAERQKFYIAWFALAGALDIGGTIFLAPAHGAIGAALAKGASQVLAGLGFLTYLVVGFRAELPIKRAARLLVACVIMFFAVRFVERRVHELVAIVIGVPMGVTIFVVLLRLFRCLDDADGDRLRRLQRVVPGRLRTKYVRLVDFVAPSTPAAPAGEPA